MFSDKIEVILTDNHVKNKQSSVHYSDRVLK